MNELEQGNLQGEMSKMEEGNSLTPPRMVICTIRIHQLKKNYQNLKKKKLKKKGTMFRNK